MNRGLNFSHLLCRAFEKENMERKCAFDCYNNDTSFTVWLKWTYFASMPCKYPVKTGFNTSLPRVVVSVELLPRDFVASIENRLWLWALTNRPSEHSSKLTWCGCLEVKPGWAFTKMLLTHLRKQLCRQRMLIWNYSPYLTLQLNWEFMGCRIINFHGDQGRIWIWQSESKDGWWKQYRGCGL